MQLTPSGFDWLTLATSLVGVLGVCLGVALAEVIRRRSRGEQFASVIFQKRLEAYETLLALVRHGGEVASKVIEDEALDAETRKSLIGDVIHLIAAHGDDHELYLDEDLSPHCMALFMGVEEIGDLAQPERQTRIDEFFRQYRNTLRMIREDSGIASVQKVFKSVNKPRIDSPFIEYLRQERRKRDQSDSG